MNTQTAAIWTATSTERRSILLKETATDDEGHVYSDTERVFLAWDIAAMRAFCRDNHIAEVQMDTAMPEEHQQALQAALWAKGASKTVRASEVEPMDDDEFWRLVNRVGWFREERPSTERGKQVLIRHLGTLERAIAFRTTFGHKRGDVQQAIRDFEDAGGEFDAYGDSYDDLVSHIVGLGRETFEREVAEPALIAQRYDEGRYTESFSYCVPWESDMLVGGQLDNERQRQRDRAGKLCARAVRDAAEEVMREHLARFPDMSRSPVRHEIESEVHRAITTVFDAGDER